MKRYDFQVRQQVFQVASRAFGQKYSIRNGKDRYFRAAVEHLTSTVMMLANKATIIVQQRAAALSEYNIFKVVPRNIVLFTSQTASVFTQSLLKATKNKFIVKNKETHISRLLPFSTILNSLQITIRTAYVGIGRRLAPHKNTITFTVSNALAKVQSFFHSSTRIVLSAEARMRLTKYLIAENETVSIGSKSGALLEAAFMSGENTVANIVQPSSDIVCRKTNRLSNITVNSDSTSSFMSDINEKTLSDLKYTEY